MNGAEFFRAAAVVPSVKPAAVRENANNIIKEFKTASKHGADLVVFPELAVTGYTCGDLFLQSRLLEEAEFHAARIISETAASSAILVFGMPLSRNGKLFNTAVVVRGGTQILGIVPKTYIPNSREYYESRWFSSANQADFKEVHWGETLVPFGSNLIFQHERHRHLSLAVELCEDLWSPIPPSSRHAVAGANILINLSASNDLIGKAEYRRSLILQQSARCLASYVYTSAGPGESTTDMVFGGHALIAENGAVLSESERFPSEPAITYGDIDTELLDHERRVSRTFAPTAEAELKDKPYRTISFSGRVASESVEEAFYRPRNPHPFVPSNQEERAARCREIFMIQTTALAVRLKRIPTKHVVIGLSGGLDSTLALLVIIGAFDRLNLPRTGIHALTMPGFGTTNRTKNNVEQLCAEMEIPLETIDIRPACELQMKELNHSGQPEDTAYENIQARYRTSLLMNKANMTSGIVIGTGDLSELALGWSTYNGDHMSMYAVNAGVPKTLVRYIIQWITDTREDSKEKEILADILKTPISPELLPPDSEGKIQQETEKTIGPYALHDFFLYHAIRHGFRPLKVFSMAVHSFAGTYGEKEIRHWLKLFYTRFFSQQFKRSCLPDGPKVGTIALSPRGDWRMPSDADAECWLEDLSTLTQNP